MITCGLDMGAGSTKGILLEDGRRVLASAMVPTRGSAVDAGRHAIERLVEEANAYPGDIDYLCTTGGARYAFPERHLQVSDITASARGAVFLAPGTRHVVDIGSQSSRAMSITETGRIVRFKMNEKCAAGAGRFVDRCAKYLQVPLSDMSTKALAAAHPKMISSVCAVLAETEIINNVADEVPLPDILMGVFLSLAQRAHVLMRYVGIQPDIALVGGLVQCDAMVRALETTTSSRIVADPRAQYAAAIGAAVLGQARLQRLTEKPTPLAALTV
ncbi:MAG: acyl-CoA dehydratase activase [Thermoplasmata archaeon]